MSWDDNSYNEDGFKIERRAGAAGTYAHMATVGANVTSYIDATVTAGATYCYRVYAFNTAGNSPYTPEACAMVPLASQTFVLTVVKSGTGSGTVSSTPAGILCGSICSAAFASDTTVFLTAAPAAGSTFVGWSGTGCSSSSSTVQITMNADKNCTATFAAETGGERNTSPVVNAPDRTRIGVFRPETGEWFLDANGNGTFDGCGIDLCASSYGKRGMLPIVGDWLGTGRSHIGIYDPDAGYWHLDNGNRRWDKCGLDGDLCVTEFGEPNSIPVVKELRGRDLLMIGFVKPEQVKLASGKSGASGLAWKFYADGDNVLDGCESSDCAYDFGAPGDIPIVGDWTGRGDDQIGSFRPKFGTWYLDENGNAKWDGTRGDALLGPFGRSGDLPVVGDWDGSGKLRIGVYRPSTGQWFLDLNGNGKLDKCGIDACLKFGLPGDLPVVGKW